MRLPDEDVDAVMAAWTLGGRDAAAAAAKTIVGGKPRLRKQKRAWMALLNEAYNRICAEERRQYPRQIVVSPTSWPGGTMMVGDTVTISGASGAGIAGTWRLDGIESGRLKLKR